MKSAYRTDQGQVRAKNEDAVLVLGDAVSGIALVADGMGGYEAGDVASQIVKKQFENAFSNLPSTPQSIEQWFREQIDLANTQIREFAQQSRITMMGTTIAGLCWHEEIMVVVHVGDSRVYALREGSLRLLTEDHSYVNVLKQMGELTEEEVRVHPKRNVITRVIGSEEQVKPDVQVFADPEFDAVLLCTDGLTTHVTDDEIEDVFGHTETVADCVNELIDRANRAGGSDNITVALVQFKDQGKDDSDAKR